MIIIHFLVDEKGMVKVDVVRTHLICNFYDLVKVPIVRFEQSRVDVELRVCETPFRSKFGDLANALNQSAKSSFFTPGFVVYVFRPVE